MAIVLTLLVLIGAATDSGALVVTEVQNFLDFYAGVVALVTLTGAVVFGLVATERITSPQVRIMVQALHRSSAFVSVGFLIAHVILEVLAGKAAVVDALFPFTQPSNNVLFLGLGTIGAHLMILAFAVGIFRRRFVPSSRPWIWRIMHSSAYVSWPIALAHGLTAGRFPDVWVQWSWAVCAAAVGIGALTRLTVSVRFANETIAAARPGVERKVPKGDGRYARARTERARVEQYRSGRPPMPPRRPARPAPPPPPPPRRGGPPRGAPARGRPPNNGLPDDEFWSKLRTEVGPLSGGRP